MISKIKNKVTQKRKTLSIKGWIIGHVKVYLSYIYTSLMLLCAYCIVHTVKRELLKKNIWLIQEKRTEARDNGYHLFRYIKETYSDLPVYYIITADSPDYDKVAQYNSIIIASSLRHYIYYIASKYSINSQAYGAAPYPSGWTYRFRKLCRKDQKVIYLKHGIDQNEMTHALDYSNTCFSLVSCAAEREQQFDFETYGYPKEVAQLLGFCRFDNLINHHNCQDQILIMPTFRNYLVSGNREKEATSEEISKFKGSDFFIKFYSLLSDKRLLQLASEKGFKIVFYLHYSLQSYIHAFKDCENDIVTIADRRKYDVQTLLLNSSILVTDYSSVFFDFAYMGKPLLYFQFDEIEYRRGHYKKGYFDYGKDGFGPVVMDKDELVDKIVELLNSGCCIEDKYLERINNFFTIRDNHNCERTYSAIIKL